MSEPSTEPQAEIPDEEQDAAQGPFLFRFIGTLTALHLLVMLLFASSFFELARVGLASPLAFLALVAGCVSLYVAAFNATVRGRPGKAAFTLAAVLLASTFWTWQVPFLVGTVAYGALLGVGGLRVAYMQQAA